MAGKIFNRMVNNLKETSRNLPEFRRIGHNQRHQILDAMMSAFSVFFFQHTAEPCTDRNDLMPATAGGGVRRYWILPVR
jgi:hypothetical protein